MGPPVYVGRVFAVMAGSVTVPVACASANSSGGVGGSAYGVACQVSNNLVGKGEDGRSSERGVGVRSADCPAEASFVDEQVGCGVCVCGKARCVYRGDGLGGTLFWESVVWAGS
jgi:hypothetical protein